MPPSPDASAASIQSSFRHVPTHAHTAATCVRAINNGNNKSVVVWAYAMQCNAMHAYAPTRTTRTTVLRHMPVALLAVLAVLLRYCCCWSFQNVSYIWRCSGCCCAFMHAQRFVGSCVLSGLGGWVFCVEKHKKWSTHVLGRWTQSQLQAGSGSGNWGNTGAGATTTTTKGCFPLQQLCMHCMHTQKGNSDDKIAPETPRAGEMRGW